MFPHASRVAGGTQDFRGGVAGKWFRIKGLGFLEGVWLVGGGIGAVSLIGLALPGGTERRNSP
jgi:hypothetical protein